MLELRDRKSCEHYGDDIWSQANKQMKACFDFLCGNHTRNLPVVRSNKVALTMRLALILTLTSSLALFLHGEA
jgi:hypothetical protein